MWVKIPRIKNQKHSKEDETLKDSADEDSKRLSKMILLKIPRQMKMMFLKMMRMKIPRKMKNSCGECHTFFGNWEGFQYHIEIFNIVCCNFKYFKYNSMIKEQIYFQHQHGHMLLLFLQHCHWLISIRSELGGKV